MLARIFGKTHEVASTVGRRTFTSGSSSSSSFNAAKSGTQFKENTAQPFEEGRIPETVPKDSGIKDNIARPHEDGRIPKRKEASRLLGGDEIERNSVDDVISVTEPVDKIITKKGTKEIDPSYFPKFTQQSEERQQK